MHLQRLLVLSALSVLVLSAVAVVPVAQSTPDGCSMDTATNPRPSAWYSLGKPADYYNDTCFHQFMVNSPDTPTIDVAIIPPAGAFGLRDANLARQSVQMWETGLKAGAHTTGMDWLRDGISIKPFVVGEDVPSSSQVIPDIVIILGDVAPYEFGFAFAGVGTDTPLSFCHPVSAGAYPSAEQIRDMPGFDGHHNNGWGTLSTSCANGSRVCAVVGAVVQDGLSTAHTNNIYDLTSHEFGHCLGLGHVGDASDVPASKNYPPDDIMSYEQDGHDPPYALCVSNLDLKTFAYRYQPLIDGAPALSYGADASGHITMAGGADPINAASTAVLDPLPASSWRIFRNDGSQATVASECPQPDASLIPVPGVPQVPPGSDGGSSGSPAITVTSPTDGQAIDGSVPLAVAGTVNRLASTSGLPTPEQHITGSVYAYNDAAGQGLGIGVSNVVLAATSVAGDNVPKYPGGTDVDVSVRCATSNNGIALATASVTFSLLDSTGALAAGPFAATTSADSDLTGAPCGTRFDPDPFTLPVTQGRYYLVPVTNGDLVIGDGASHALKAIEIVGPPAVPGTSASPIGVPTSFLGALAGFVGPIAPWMPLDVNDGPGDAGCVLAPGPLIGIGDPDIPTDQTPLCDGTASQPFMDITKVWVSGEGATAFDVSLQVADMSSLPPSVDDGGIGLVGFSTTYGVEFCTDNNVLASRGYTGAYAGETGVCYTLSAVHGVNGDAFGMNYMQQDPSTSCGVDGGPLDASGSAFDLAHSTVTWRILKAKTDVDAISAGLNDCPNGVSSTVSHGDGIATGDHLSRLSGQSGNSVVAGIGVTFFALGDRTDQDTATYTFNGGSALPLAASAGGPYSGGVAVPIAISGSASGGASPYSCAWTGASATFADAAQCTTTVSFADAGAHTITLTVTDAASATATSDAQVTTSNAPPPAGEHVSVVLEGASGSTDVSTSQSSPTASWSLSLDLSGVATGTYTLTATWYDDDGTTVLATAAVSNLQVTAAGGGSTDCPDGTNSCVVVDNSAPVLDSFVAPASSIQPDSEEHTLTFTGAAHDDNGRGTTNGKLDPSTAIAVASIKTGGVDHLCTGTGQQGCITVDAPVVADGADALSVTFSVAVHVPTGLSAGVYDVAVTVTDSAGLVNAQQTPPMAHFTLYDPGGLTLTMPSGGALTFGGSAFQPGQDAHSDGYFEVGNTVRDATGELAPADLTLTFAAFANDGGDRITADHVDVLIDPTGQHDFAGASPVTLEGAQTLLGTMAAGATWDIQVVVHVPTGVGSGVYGATFAVGA